MHFLNATHHLDKFQFIVDISSLQQIFGHKSIATPEIYTHVDDNQLDTAVNASWLTMMFNCESY